MLVAAPGKDVSRDELEACYARRCALLVLLYQVTCTRDKGYTPRSAIADPFGVPLWPTFTKALTAAELPLDAAVLSRR
jgi:hypothetical protein